MAGTRLASGSMGMRRTSSPRRRIRRAAEDFAGADGECVAHDFPRQACDDHGAVEKALMVGRNNERTRFREFFDALDLQLEQVAEHEEDEPEAKKINGSGDGVIVVDDGALGVSGRFVDYFCPARGGTLAGSAGVSDHGIDEIAHGVDLRGDGVGDAGTHLLIERYEQLDALHGIEAEIEFEIVAGMRRVFLQLGGGMNNAQSLADCRLLHPFRFFGG